MAQAPQLTLSEEEKLMFQRMKAEQARKQRMEAQAIRAIKLDEGRHAAIAESDANLKKGYAYQPPTPEQKEANKADDQKAAEAYGEEYYEENKWKGHNIPSGVFAWGLNKLTGDKKRAKGTKQKAGEIARERRKTEQDLARNAGMGLAQARAKATGDINAATDLAHQQNLSQDVRIAATAKQGKLGRESTEGLQKSRQAEKRKELVEVFYHDPTDINKSLRLLSNSREELFNGDGTPYTGPKNLKKWQDPSTGSRGNAAAKYADEKVLKEVSTIPFMNNFRRVFTAPKDELQAATGSILDIQTNIAKYGAAGEESTFYNSVQDIQGALGQLTFESVGPLLEKLGVNPSNTDVKIAFQTAVDKGNNIPALVGVYKRTVIPTIVGKARANGVRSEAEINAIEAELMGIVEQAEKQYMNTDKPKTRTERKKRIQDIEAKLAEIGRN
ncbi:MAG: hypothetical protein CL475_00160 [Acidobacteria bacterium]|nr:hypothetical protein [Acidobacteriota bacterium]